MTTAATRCMPQKQFSTIVSRAREYLPISIGNSNFPLRLYERFRRWCRRASPASAKALQPQRGANSVRLRYTIEYEQRGEKNLENKITTLLLLLKKSKRALYSMYMELFFFVLSFSSWLILSSVVCSRFDLFSPPSTNKLWLWHRNVYFLVSLSLTHSRHVAQRSRSFAFQSISPSSLSLVGDIVM